MAVLVHVPDLILPVRQKHSKLKLWYKLTVEYNALNTPGIVSYLVIMSLEFLICKNYKYDHASQKLNSNKIIFIIIK